MLPVCRFRSHQVSGTDWMYSVGDKRAEAGVLVHTTGPGMHHGVVQASLLSNILRRERK